MSPRSKLVMGGVVIAAIVTSLFLFDPLDLRSADRDSEGDERSGRADDPADAPRLQGAGPTSSTASSKEAPGEPRRRAVPEGPGAIQDPAAWDTWHRAFVTESVVQKPPAQYRGSETAWRLKSQHPVSSEQLKVLVRNARRLPPKDRIALLQRITRTASGDVAAELTRHSTPFTESRALLHGLYAEALLGHVRRGGGAEGSTGAEDAAPEALVEAILDADAEFLAERHDLATRAWWLAFERRVDKLGDLGFRTSPRLAPSWERVERALAAPLLAVEKGRAPAYAHVRARVLERLASATTAPSLTGLLSDWPRARAWLSKAPHTPTEELPNILRSILRCAWPHVAQREQDDLVAYLRGWREGDTLTDAEQQAVVSFVRSAMRRPPTQLSEAAKTEFDAWVPGR